LPIDKKRKENKQKKIALLYRDKFIFWSLVALIFVKVVFSYSGSQLASIISGVPIFAKEEIISQTNTFRKILGLEELKESPILDQAASQKLQDMINGQYFAHTSPKGISPWYWFELNNYNFIYAGENLAIGFTTAKETVDAWKNSPSHRANLANPNFKEIGIAVAPARIQNNEGILVVQLFGTPQPTKPPVLVKKPSPSPLLPKISPTNLPQISSSPIPLISAQQPTQQTNQQIETSFLPEAPTSVTIANLTPRLAKFSKTLNTALIVYSLLAFLVLLVFIVFTGARKELVIRTSISLAIVIMALVIPVIQISRTALIF
jgi:hypothetical protein